MARLRDFFKREKRDVNFDLKGDTLLKHLNDLQGINVTPTSAMKFTGVLAAVSLRSELTASFPKVIYKNTPEGREPLWDDPLYKIIAYQPNPYMNAFTFWELLNTHLDLWGNSYAFISRSKKRVIGLTPIDPSFVTIKIEGGKLIYRVNGTKDPKLDKDHFPNKFLHFKDISLNGYEGMSRITQAKKAIELGLQAEDYGLNFFTKKGNAKGVIEMEGQLDPEGFKNFKEHWDKNADQGTPILDMGKKYKPLTIPPEDAQFLQSRQFQIQDIARIFRVPPHLLADLSRATFSNIEQADIQFVKYGLRPMVKRYEHELEAKLLGDDLGKKSIRFNLDGILRGDTASRTAFYSAMVQ
ncbi:hypothetical protein LCGC14_1437960, partial [marine sediment metagenome]